MFNAYHLLCGVQIRYLYFVKQLFAGVTQQCYLTYYK